MTYTFGSEAAMTTQLAVRAVGRSPRRARSPPGCGGAAESRVEVGGERRCETRRAAEVVEGRRAPQAEGRRELPRPTGR